MKVKIKIRSKLQAGPGINIANADANTIISTSRATSASGAEGDAVDAVQGSDSKLAKVVRHSTYATPTAFPTILKTVASGVTARMDVDGISCETSTFDFLVEPDELKAGLYNNTLDSIVLDVSGDTADIIVTRGSRTLSIREIDVCDSGVAKKMLVLGCAPYVP